MYDYHAGTLPPVFSGSFKSLHKVHQHNTRLASKHLIICQRSKQNLESSAFILMVLCGLYCSIIKLHNK